MRLHLPVMMRAALMAALLAGGLPAEEAAACMAAGDTRPVAGALYVAPPTEEEAGDAEARPVELVMVEGTLTPESLYRQLGQQPPWLAGGEMNGLEWLDTVRHTMSGNVYPQEGTLRPNRAGLVYAADDRMTARDPLPAAVERAATETAAARVRETPATYRRRLAATWGGGLAGTAALPPRLAGKAAAGFRVGAVQQAAPQPAITMAAGNGTATATVVAEAVQPPATAWHGAVDPWFHFPAVAAAGTWDTPLGADAGTDDAEGAGAPMPPAEAADSLTQTTVPADGNESTRPLVAEATAPRFADPAPAEAAVQEVAVQEVAVQEVAVQEVAVQPESVALAAEPPACGAAPVAAPLLCSAMPAVEYIQEQTVQLVAPSASVSLPVSYGTVEPATVADMFPANDATVTISGLVEVTPATMPAWTGTTGILGPAVTEVAGTDKNTLPDSLILDAQHGNRWVMQVGAGTGAGSSKTVYVRYLDTFALKNLGDTAGVDASSLDFGITSGANSANTSLNIQNNNEVDLLDNVRLVTSAHGFINLQGTLSVRDNARVNISGNKVLSTCGNTVRNVHGTIHADDSVFLINNKEYLRVEDNGIVIGPADNCYVGVRGGVAFAKAVSITNNPGAVYIRNNTITHQEGVDTSAEALGGAVDSREISLSNNKGKVEVSGNGVDLSAASWGTLRGGAFSVELIAYIAFTPTVTPWGDGGTTNLSMGVEPGPVISGLGSNVVPAVGITINGNKADVEISRNYLKCGGGTSSGGALYCQGNEEDNNASIAISSNKAGLVFADNYASGRTVRGGAICAAEFTDFTLTSNADVAFTGNTIQGMVEGDDLKGGAIYIDDDAKTIKFTNNTKLVFRGNAEISHDGSVLLRSVYANTDNTTYTAKASSLELTPANGGSLEVYDSITLINSSDANKVVSINKLGSTQKTGTVLFSGKYTEADLAAVKGEAPTAAEVEASRTNVIEGATVSMQSGTLAIKDSAKLLIHGKAETDSSEFASELVLEAGDLIIQESALTTFDNMTISLARGSNGLTSHLAGTSTTAGGPVLKVTNGLTINVADVKGATHGISFLAVDGMNLDMGGTVQLAITGFDGFEPGLRYDLIDISHAGDGWEDFLTYMAPTFTIDGEAYETALYVHEDSRSVYLLKAAPVPEPATATLSLLALAALAARRRRWC